MIQFFLYPHTKNNIYKMCISNYKGVVYMKKLIPFIIIVMFVVSGLEAVALQSDVETQNVNNLGDRTFTHTVFAEYGSTAWCPHCPYVHTALKNIYYGGWYPFYYTSLALEHNTHADARAAEYNLYYIPDTFFDGGYQVYCGSVNDNIQQTMSQFNTSITQCGNRAVPDIETVLTINWLGNATMDIQVSVQNKDAALYKGRIRVYVTEIVSTMGWVDAQNHPYTFAFLDYAFNEVISIDPSGTWSDSITWDGHNYNDGLSPPHDFGGIQNGNIMVMAAVFNATGHTAYSDAPYSYLHPFTAYYADDAVGATPQSNSAPDKPAPPSGPTSGRVNVEYNYSGNTIDPNGDDIYYLFDWGDGTDSGWLGPYPSGTTVVATHSWKYGGTYNVKLKAKDAIVDGPWSDPLVVQIAGPNIEVKNVKGGLFKVSAEIRNTGDVEISNVNWNITLHYGVLIGKETTGMNLTIPENSSATIKSRLILGLGSTIIKVEAWIPDGPSAMIQRTGTIFLFFIKVNP